MQGENPQNDDKGKHSAKPRKQYKLKLTYSLKYMGKNKIKFLTLLNNVFLLC